MLGWNPIGEIIHLSFDLAVRNCMKLTQFRTQWEWWTGFEFKYKIHTVHRLIWYEFLLGYYWQPGNVIQIDILMPNKLQIWSWFPFTGRCSRSCSCSTRFVLPENHWKQVVNNKFLHINFYRTKDTRTHKHTIREVNIS